MSMCVCVCCHVCVCLKSLSDLPTVKQTQALEGRSIPSLQSRRHPAQEQRGILEPGHIAEIRESSLQCFV